MISNRLFGRKRFPFTANDQADLLKIVLLETVDLAQIFGNIFLPVCLPYSYLYLVPSQIELNYELHCFLFLLSLQKLRRFDVLLS